MAVFSHLCHSSVLQLLERVHCVPTTKNKIDTIIFCFICDYGSEALNACHNMPFTVTVLIGYLSAFAGMYVLWEQKLYHLKENGNGPLLMTSPFYSCFPSLFIQQGQALSKSMGCQRLGFWWAIANTSLLTFIQQGRNLPHIIPIILVAVGVVFCLWVVSLGGCAAVVTVK